MITALIEPYLPFVEREPNNAPDAVWIDAHGHADTAVDFIPELEHYEAPSPATFLHNVRPDAVIANPRNDYPSLQDTRYWYQDGWEGQFTLNMDDNLGGNHTYLDNPNGPRSGQNEYPGMLPIESYKVVTRRGNNISFTDYVDQSELYA